MIRPPELGCLHRAHQGPYGTHVDEPKERGRNKSGEKRTLPTSRQQTSGKPELSVFVFSSGLCLYCQTAAFPTLPLFLKQGRIQSAHINGQSVRENQVLQKNPPGVSKLSHKDSVLVPPLTQRKEGEASCSKLCSRQSQKYEIIGIILVCLA